MLAHAFRLLDAAGPVFEVFPESIHDDSSEVLACTLPPRSDPNAHPAVDEVRGLRPAYDRAVVRYGNRAGTGRVVDADHVVRGRAGVDPQSPRAPPWKEAGIPGVPARVAQDVRGYYETAVLGLTDHVPVGVDRDPLVLRRRPRPAASSSRARTAMRDADVKQPIWFYMAPGDR